MDSNLPPEREKVRTFSKDLCTSLQTCAKCVLSHIKTLCRFGAVACGVGMELYVFGGVRSRENEQNSEMVACKSEFYHDDFKRYGNC